MKALIVVDIQNDFVEGGALAVPGGREIIPVVNDLMGKFELVAATQDWHPEDHGSFAPEPDKIGTVIQLNGLDQILWPVHCVAEENGAEFVPGLETDKFDTVIRKGTNPGFDSYSGFFDNARKQATGLEEWLKARNVTEVYITGLATDYCVKFTVLDAVDLGFKTYVVQDACRGVNLNADDTEKALREMEQAGAEVITAADCL